MFYKSHEAKKINFNIYFKFTKLNLNKDFTSQTNLNASTFKETLLKE